MSSLTYFSSTPQLATWAPFQILRHRVQVSWEGAFGLTSRYDHSIRVAETAMALAKTFGVGGNDLVALEAAALFHDIGHLPYSHQGEFIVNRDLGGFNHNDHAAYILTGVPFIPQGTTEIICSKGKPGSSALAQILDIADMLTYIADDLDAAELEGLFVGPDAPEALQHVTEDGLGYARKMIREGAVMELVNELEELKAWCSRSIYHRLPTKRRYRDRVSRFIKKNRALGREALIDLLSTLPDEAIR